MSQPTQHMMLAALRMLLVLGLLAMTSAQAEESLQDDWISLGILDFTTTHHTVVLRGHGKDHDIGNGRKGCYLAQVPARGTWTLEVGSSAVSAAEPRIELFEPTSSPQASIYIQEQLAASLKVQVFDAGRYWVCLSAQDPRQVLDDYRLYGAFQAAPVGSEIDPNKHESESSCSNYRKSEEDPDEHEPDALITVGTPISSLDSSVCRSLRADDHGDTLRCATTLEAGFEMAAKIENDWSDDRDVFVFQIDALTSVEVEVTGSSDLVVALYESSGNRLGTANSPTEKHGFRFARTLTPGFYYVATESRYGLPIGYQLRLRDLGNE